MIEKHRETAGHNNHLDAFGKGFEDWAQLISFHPRLFFKPQSIEALKGFLLSVYQGPFEGMIPRVLGSMHSCSRICESDAIIDVGDLPQTIEFSPDYSSVTVSANWHFHDFLLALSQHGKSITATGGTDEQTLAGIISTNTAPATPHTTIYELLQWVEYLTIDEQQHAIIEKQISKTDPDFRAVIGSLGAMGVITRVMFNLVDELFFETIQKIVPINEVLKDLEKTSKKYDFWRVDWVPDTDKGLLWAAKMIPFANPAGDYRDDQAENILITIFNVLDRLESAGPLLDNSMRILYGGLTLTYGEVKASGPLRNMLPVDRRAPLHVAMAEWAFKPSDTQKLLAACRVYFEQNGWPNLPIEIEQTRTDDYYMSAWNWPGLDYIIKFNFMYLTDVCKTPEDKQAIYDHLHGLWNYLVETGIQFKAHWGKINFIDSNFTSLHYQFEEFKPFMKPMFLNPYLRERFYK
ncbi:MAG TPA: D-arabinono-1,4-lactone oxidase [Longilinea sp.]|nr:D-arabinono-1,4-lactone oxidase [Longilinea sp.]